MSAPTSTRRRRSDSECSRRTILQTAAKLATVEGLEGISNARLADASEIFDVVAKGLAAPPGRVKEEVAEFQRGWDERMERLLDEARDRGELDAETDTAQLAFELGGISLAANAGFLLWGDPAVFERARRGIERLLAA